MSVITRPPSPAAQAPSRDAVMVQARSENFPVASYLLGRRQRTHLLAIYGFARLVDDLGDEASGDRLSLLAWLEGELDSLYAGRSVEHPVMQSLGPTIAACNLPRDPFWRLIEANRRDQTVTRYETFEDLLGYCQVSAAPVGELVLHVFGAASPERIRLSDRVCAGLQVTEHLQDVMEDHARGRVYLPQQDLSRFECPESELTPAGVPGPRLRALIAFEVDRARSLLAAGAPLAPMLGPRPRAAVAGFIAGGRAALEAIERAGYDVGQGPGPPTRRAFVEAWARAVMGR
ncbi:MAG: squalene synthase HpnC [Solirubrobacterales bacterium]|nr:squalene synthase HpnC [Solirubrobacterales bacterium]